MASGRMKSHVVDQSEEASKLGLTGTPSFLVGTQRNGVVQATYRMSGARDLPEFRKLIELGSAKQR